MHALMREILLTDIPLASERVRDLGAPPLPPGFDGWFARCVARAPDDRFADATELYQAYERMLAGEVLPPALARTTPSISAERQRAPRGGARIALATALVLGVSVVAAASLSREHAFRQTLPNDSVRDEARWSASPPPETPAPPASASASASALAVASPPPSGPPPFDAKAARSKMSEVATRAFMACRFMEGPNIVVVSATWSTDGSPTPQVQARAADRTHRHSCVENVFEGARVQPFSGPAPTLQNAITFP